ncbi:MAG TPA: hypothetical protein VF666_05790 [Pyrinomonadaceae bacterium]|jgi:hypothetical protein
MIVWLACFVGASNNGMHPTGYEMGDDGYTARQIEVYENGVTLKYDSSHLEDEYGFLSDQPLEPKKNGVPEASAEEFEAA